MKKLIVNADDFGIHEEVNRAIIDGFLHGCLRSTSLIASGSAFEEAVMLTKEHPKLGVGVHLTFVAEKPVLPPDKIPTLVDEKGFFHKNHVVFIKRYLLGKIDRDELKAEASAQIEKILSFGIHPTHLDSHQHLHVLPNMEDIFISLAHEYKILKIRLPREGYAFRGAYPAPFGRYLAKWGLTFCANRLQNKFHDAKIIFPDHFFGMLAGGHLAEPYFLAILKALPRGVSEIMIHPGRNNKILDKNFKWNYHWEEELLALKSPIIKAEIERNNIDLISFKELSYGTNS